MNKSEVANQPLRDSMAHKAKHLPSSTSKDARALRSAQALREALLALLERKPFEQITIRDICAEAEVSYATYFRHHPTKDSLLEDIATDQIRRLSDLTLAVRGASDFHAGFRALCVYIDEHRALWSTLLNGGAGAAMRAEWVRVSQRVAASEPQVKGWLTQELGTICAATLIAETLAWWLGQPHGAHSIDEVASILLRLTTFIMAPD